MPTIFYSSNLALSDAAVLRILIDAGVKSLLLLAAVGLVACIFRRSSAAARHWIWSLGLCGTLLLPALPGIVPHWSLKVMQLPAIPSSPAHGPEYATLVDSRVASGIPPQHAQQAMPTAAEHAVETPEPFSEIHAPSLAASPEGAAANKAEIARPRQARNNPWTLEAITLALVGSWAVGFLAVLLPLAAGVFSTWRLCARATQLADPDWQELLGRCACEVGVHGRVGLWQSVAAVVPFTWGIWRPLVVLPIDASQWSHDRRRVVLLHELAHVRRRDILFQWLGRLACALYWFNPLAWHALHRLRVERELACDDCVIETGVLPTDYASQLLAITRAYRPHSLSPALGMASGSKLETRISALLDRARSHLPIGARQSALLLTAVALLVALLASIELSGRRGPQSHAQELGAKQPAPPAVAVQQKIRTMRVTAMGPEGKPVPGAKIHSSIWTKEPFLANRDYLTDENGRADVELPGSLSILRLWATQKGFIPLFAHWESGEHDEGQRLPGHFQFELRTGGTIGGFVKNAAGEPVVGAKVEVMLSNAEKLGKGIGRVSYNTWLAEGNDAVTTDAQGRWTLKDVPEDKALELLVKISHPDFISDPQWGTYQRAQEVTTADFRKQTAVVVLPGGHSIVGHVTDPAGRPVAGALVVWGDDPYLKRDGSSAISTGEDGSYKLPPRGAGPLRLTVVAAGWMPQMRKHTVEPQPKPVDFQLRRGQTIKIRAVDERGLPILKAAVSIRKWRGVESLYNHKHPNVIESGIPRRVSAEGIYEWTWAPDDEVEYEVWSEGFVSQQVSLSADGKEHKVVLSRSPNISGQVTDAATGRGIEAFDVIPVLIFQPESLVAERMNKIHGKGGRYQAGLDRQDVSYRLRIEAPGYRSAIGPEFRAGEVDGPIDFQLQPAEPTRGRVLSPSGKPVPEASVCLASRTQEASLLDGKVSSDDNMLFASTKADGSFEFPAQCEPYVVLATAAEGYAELSLAAEKIPGDVELRPWAKISGRLWHAGKPVPKAKIDLWPARAQGGSAPQINQHQTTTTGGDGHFTFAQVPPAKMSLRAALNVWSEFPITSSQSVPLDISPGQEISVELGGRGAQISGQVVLTGDVSKNIDLSYSLNYLVRRQVGIAPPEYLLGKEFDWSKGLAPGWLKTRDGQAHLPTWLHYVVKLGANGGLVISGVSAGDYDLSLEVYDKPEGCLVNPIGTRVVRVKVSDDDVRKGQVDLGRIEVKAALPPTIGQIAPGLVFTPLGGDKKTLHDFRGQHVLVDFWATWCEPCRAELPKLAAVQETYKNRGLVVLSLSVDADQETVERYLKQHPLGWLQGYLDPAQAAESFGNYGITSVPACILIDPDGKIVARGPKCDSVDGVLRRALEPQ